MAFPSSGIIRSDASTGRLYRELTSGEGLTVEVWADANGKRQYGPARLVSYSINHTLRNFTVGQHGFDLRVRLRTTQTDLNGFDPGVMVVKNVFESAGMTHLVVTYDFERKQVYVNGDLKADASMPGGRFSNWDLAFPLVLGNEATGDRPWTGTLSSVAIYNRPLSEIEVQNHHRLGAKAAFSYASQGSRSYEGLVALFSFTEASGTTVYDRSGKVEPIDLSIPMSLSFRDQVVVFFPFVDFQLTMKHVVDLGQNILGFIPFGFLLYALVLWRGYTPEIASMSVLFCGFLVSFLCEFLQLFLDSRWSSMTDVTMNVLGIAVGIVIGGASWGISKMPQQGLESDTIRLTSNAH